MRILLSFLLLSGLAFAQTQQPEKESSQDLRSGINIFVIEDISEENLFWLERTSGLDYMLHMKDEDDEEKIQKVTTKDAQKLEKDFASRFLKIQYELPASEEGCKVVIRLTLKGEVQDICKKDDKKNQEITPFMKDLEKLLAK